MAQIAATPSPLIATPPANTAASGNAANDAAAASSGDGSSASNPFAAVLQRMVKGQSGQDQSTLDAARLVLQQQTGQVAAANDTGDAQASLMASFQAQLLGLQTPATDAKEEKSLKADDDKDEKSSDDTSAASSLAGLLAAAAPQTPVTKESSGESGKDDISLAARPAILSPTDEKEGRGTVREDKENSGDFQALLESARNLQAGQANSTESHSAAGNTAVAEAKIETPVGQPRWSQEVGDKVAWMVGKQESKAELVLTPPHMGRIEVSITLNGDQASASFSTQNPAAREALENALPKLKEVLADAGVQLGQTQVGADTRQDAPQQQERRDNSRRGGNTADSGGDSVTGLGSLGASGASSTQWIQQGNGLVDTFA